MSYQYILFDLDGTLTDPKIGITKSVAFALLKMKQWIVPLEELTKFIGPPLKESFMTYYHFTEHEAEEAIYHYREYFKDIGIYENEVYSGIEELLQQLKDSEKILSVATSKPTVFAEEILRYFGLEKYFTCVLGSHLDGRRTKKSEVIEAVMEELSELLSEELKQPVSPINKKEMIMIGDREHDIFGANQVGIDSIGVEYGYGDFEELTKAGATSVVSSVEALKQYLLYESV